MLVRLMRRPTIVHQGWWTGMTRTFHGSASNLDQDDLMLKYQELVDRGELERNTIQHRAVGKLGRISSLVERYHQDSEIHHVRTQEAGSEEDVETKPLVPRGLYIYGRVGVGKSMLMDLFYNATNIQRKRRAHFHEFMLDAHQRIFALKQQDLKEKGRNTHVDTALEGNPVFRVGEALAGEASLLCFDEFQVTDIADAMIMSTLFRAMWSKGVVVVATSNRHPSQLYENGLNREYFVPFVELLEQQCRVYRLDGSEDYRLRAVASENCLFYPLSSGATEDLHKGLKEELRNNERSLGSLDKVWGEHVTVPVRMGRSLSVQTPCEGIACVSFSDMCEQPLGAADYEALAMRFNTVYLRDVPVLTKKQFDEAKRFLILVDVLYEYQISLRMSAAAPPPEILREIVETGNSSSQVDAHGVSQIATSAAMSEISFAAERAISRLIEMTGEKKH
eukprot:gb/GECG01015714.1/.p1 GENE.gb/GECG01015714.1/~~gb/GECG01015714.1/.p1  ORF type:complete len:449 (+),score=56.32 gb/GECG01015714.1/:1-1347(+)